MRYLVLHQHEGAWGVVSSDGCLITTSDPQQIGLTSRGEPPAIQVRGTTVPLVDIGDLLHGKSRRRTGLLAWLGAR